MYLLKNNLKWLSEDVFFLIEFSLPTIAVQLFGQQVDAETIYWRMILLIPNTSSSRVYLCFW